MSNGPRNRIPKITSAVDACDGRLSFLHGSTGAASVPRAPAISRSWNVENYLHTLQSRLREGATYLT